MPNVHRKYQGNTTTYVQSVRFKKENFTKDEAHKWCKDHGYYVDGLDETDNEYWFRQYDPDNEKWKYLVKDIDTGLYFILGVKK